MASIISKIAKLLGHDDQKKEKNISNQNVSNKKVSNKKLKPSDYDDDYLRFDSSKLIPDPSTSDEFYKANRYQPIDTEKQMAVKLGLFDLDEVDKLFEEKICYRGCDYFYKDKISNYIQNGDHYKCNVQGTNLYNCELTIKDNKIKDMKCDCEYFKAGNNCKHLYALLYKAKLKDNHDKLIVKANEVIDEAKNIIAKGQELVNDYKLVINLSDLNYMLGIYSQKVEEFKEKIKTLYGDYYFLNMLRFMINANEYYKKRLEAINQVIDDYNAGKYKDANILPDTQKANRKRIERQIITYNEEDDDIDKDDIDLDYLDDLDDFDEDLDEFDDDYDYAPRKKKGFFDIDEDDFFRALILKDLFKD